MTAGTDSLQRDRTQSVRGSLHPERNGGSERRFPRPIHSRPAQVPFVMIRLKSAGYASKLS